MAAYNSILWGEIGRQHVKGASGSRYRSIKKNANELTGHTFPSKLLVLSFMVLTTFLQSSVYLNIFHFERPRISAAVHFFPPARFDKKIYFRMTRDVAMATKFFSPDFCGIFAFLVYFSKPSSILIMYTICNTNSINSDCFCTRVSMAIVHV